jgi:hypothetical protein
LVNRLEKTGYIVWIWLLIRFSAFCKLLFNKTGIKKMNSE